jgi:arsenite-transporting ATPase
MVGIPLLGDMGREVYGERPVTDVLFRDQPIRVRRRAGGYVLVMRLPFVSREDMDIHRRGEELYVRVGTYKRNLVLPQTLQRLEVRGANFVGDHLEIAFARASTTDAAEAEGRTRA